MSNQELTLRFFLQLACILIVCRLAGALMPRVHQPKVIGEMIAGVLLGPSLLGWVAPSIHAALFPPSSLAVISVVSQIGIALYMFVVGTHLQTDFIKYALRTAMLISVAGIVAPFVLGAGLAVFLLRDGRFFGASVSDWTGMLYLGAAMSVTAFPVLARIIQDRGIAGTAVGTFALAAGATSDAVAWCLLAIVLATFNQNAAVAVTAIGGGLVYVVVAIGVVRPRLSSLAAKVEQAGSVNADTLMLILALVLAAAWFTEAVGLHAVFGAFVMGLVIPRGQLTDGLSRHIEPLATTLLVPLFFVYSGLSTRIGLLSSPDLFGVAIVVTVVATAGKGVACWAAAIAAGRPNNEAIGLGALMNARGLMELIILNIALERELITETLFTIMVTMTIATTLAAGPLFDWAWRRSAEVRHAAGVRAH